MKIIAIIPARYKSSRFPGKPLVDIHGKPMIWWVYQHCLMVPVFDGVYVATDDSKIQQVCNELGINVVMTSEDNQTSTDRIGEVAEKIPADLYIYVRGDEPLMEPAVMSTAIKPFFTDEDLQISNCMTRIEDPVEVVNFTVPEVITNKDCVAVYLTRSTAPYPKGIISYDYYEQVCVYGFKPEALKFFWEYGKKYGKSKIEEIEDIEILRFVENGYRIQFVEVDSYSIAVDTPKDLERVRSVVDRLVESNEIDIKLS